MNLKPYCFPSNQSFATKSRDKICLKFPAQGRPNKSWTDNISEWTNMSITHSEQQITEENGKISSEKSTVPQRLEKELTQSGLSFQINVRPGVILPPPMDLSNLIYKINSKTRPKYRSEITQQSKYFNFLFDPKN